MPKLAKELSDIEVRRLGHNGKGWRTLHSVGGCPGLSLQVLQSGAKTWVLRYADGKSRKELALGAYPDVTLKAARSRGHAQRGRIDIGIDPVAELAVERETRRLEEEAAKLKKTNALNFDQAATKYLDWKLAEFENAKHRKQWASTLSTYASPYIGHMPVSDIQIEHVVATLKPIWGTKTETAKRLRGRIEAVLSWATSSGLRSGPNPATWQGNLDTQLPQPSKIAKVTHQGAIAVEDVEDWFGHLRKREGMATRALEFLTLTAARSGEIRGATWDEIDFSKNVWAIPAERMKMRHAHRVPLPKAAVQLLRRLPRMQREPEDNRPDYVFWAPRGGMLSDMSLSAVMRRMNETATKDGHIGWLDPTSNRPAVPHGLRSTFRNWAAETGQPYHMAEIALAHSVGSDTERAYLRSDMLERRREMMDAWAEFIGADKVSLRVLANG